jgi:hypothetical protein
VAVIDGADSASISGTIVTVNVPVKPKNFVNHAVLDLLFTYSSRAVQRISYW